MKFFLVRRYSNLFLLLRAATARSGSLSCSFSSYFKFPPAARICQSNRSPSACISAPFCVCVAGLYVHALTHTRAHTDARECFQRENSRIGGDSTTPIDQKRRSNTGTGGVSASAGSLLRATLPRATARVKQEQQTHANERGTRRRSAAAAAKTVGRKIRVPGILGRREARAVACERGAFPSAIHQGRRGARKKMQGFAVYSASPRQKRALPLERRAMLRAPVNAYALTASGVPWKRTTPSFCPWLFRSRPKKCGVARMLWPFASLEYMLIL